MSEKLTDIVQRLYEHAEKVHESERGIFNEAAAEIESLRWAVASTDTDYETALENADLLQSIAGSSRDTAAVLEWQVCINALTSSRNATRAALTTPSDK